MLVLWLVLGGIGCLFINVVLWCVEELYPR
jgi:hypothetical protein